jgi:hypothetical protein
MKLHRFAFLICASVLLLESPSLIPVACAQEPGQPPAAKEKARPNATSPMTAGEPSAEKDGPFPDPSQAGSEHGQCGREAGRAEVQRATDLKMADGRFSTRENWTSSWCAISCHLDTSGENSYDAPGPCLTDVWVGVASVSWLDSDAE